MGKHVGVQQVCLVEQAVCAFHCSCTGSYSRRSGRCAERSVLHAPPLHVACAATAASPSSPLTRYCRERCARQTFVSAGNRMDVLSVESLTLLARKVHIGVFTRPLHH